MYQKAVAEESGATLNKRKRSTRTRLHPCVATVKEMCKPHIRRRGMGRPRDRIGQRAHITRLSKRERELPRD
jgi:hypothetical protein